MFYDGTHHFFRPLEVTLTVIQLTFTKGLIDANVCTTVMFMHYFMMFSQQPYELGTFMFSHFMRKLRLREVK